MADHAWTVEDYVDDDEAPPGDPGQDCDGNGAATDPMTAEPADRP